MPTSIETLKSIQYSNLNQLMEDLNFNFAVLENSPLYKGIPGKPGASVTGSQGIRGIKFAFVQLSNFVSVFGDVSLGSQINLNYLTAKLQTFDNKNKLLQALGLTEFIDKDIVVMTDTIMLSYSLETNTFINTGIAFNQQANLLNNLQQQIEQSINDILATNQTLNNLTNIFEGYVTIAKNYSDTNNIDITPTLTASSVYAPYVPGYNNNIGVPIENHKYFGFADSKLGLNDNGTTVFGSMKRYINLMDGSYSIGDVDQTLVSDYAPGIGNIPSAVFLQDTDKNGIMFGLKDRTNFKRFASIFKNDINELVLKSDQGTNPSEYSQLLLHQNYLKFAKLVQFGNDLEITRDLKVFGNILNDYLKTGQFTDGANLGNQYNVGVTEIGKVPTGPVPNTVTKHKALLEKFESYLSKVLVTTSDGTLSKDYSLESGELTVTAGLSPFVNPNVNSAQKFITSNYLDLVIQKLNNIITGIGNDYWSKSQFPTGVIPRLTLSTNLFIPGTFNANYTNDFVEVTASLLKIGSSAIEFSNFVDKVLVTDEDGLLTTMYAIEKQALNPLELQLNALLNIFTSSTGKILTTNYYIHLATKINQLVTQIVTINDTLVLIYDQISDLTDYVNYELGLTNQSITDLENDINQQISDINQNIFDLETATNQSFVDLALIVSNLETNINNKLLELKNQQNKANIDFNNLLELKLTEIYDDLKPKIIKLPIIDVGSLIPDTSWKLVKRLDIDNDHILSTYSSTAVHNLSKSQYQCVINYRFIDGGSGVTYVDLMLGWFKPERDYNTELFDFYYNNAASSWEVSDTVKNWTIAPNFWNSLIIPHIEKFVGFNTETGRKNNIVVNGNLYNQTAGTIEAPSGNLNFPVDFPFPFNTSDFYFVSDVRHPEYDEPSNLGYHRTKITGATFKRFRLQELINASHDSLQAASLIIQLIPKTLSYINIKDYEKLEILDENYNIILTEVSQYDILGTYPSNEFNFNYRLNDILLSDVNKIEVISYNSLMQQEYIYEIDTPSLVTPPNIYTSNCDFVGVDAPTTAIILSTLVGIKYFKLKLTKNNGEIYYSNIKERYLISS